MGGIVGAIASVVVSEFVGPWAAETLFSTLVEDVAGNVTAGSIFGSSLSAATGGRIIGAAAGTITAGAIAQITGRVSKGQPSAAAAAQTGALVNVASAYAPIPVNYGFRRRGGARALSEVAGAKNEQLHVIIVWGEGEIEGVPAVYLDDTLSTDSLFSGLVTIEHHTGTDGQAASAAAIAALSGKWGTSDTLSGLAYTYLQFTWSDAAFARGIPTVTADIRGRKIYDPRDGITRFSNNPALVLRDYLTNARYGLKAPSAMIDDTAITAAANHCEERLTAPSHSVTFTADASADLVTLPAADSFSLGMGVRVSSVGTLPAPLAVATTYYWIPVTNATGKLATSAANALAGTAIDLTDAGSGTHTVSAYDFQRYTCDGDVDIDRTRMENIRALLSSCRGFLVFSGGKYILKIDKSETPISFTLNEDNIVGAWRINLPQKRGRVNRVRASFFDQANYYQPNVSMADSATYRTQDGGTLIEQQLDLPYTTDVYRTQQMAAIVLAQGRLGIACELTATIAATQLEVGDVVRVTHTTPGWVNQYFRVVGVQLQANDEVRLALAQYDAATYAAATQIYAGPPITTNLPNPLNVRAPGTPSVTESLYQTTGSAGVKSRATVTWAASADQFVVNGGRYQLEYQLSGASSWKIGALVQSSFTSVDVFDLAAGTYNFRVKAINSAGVPSAYSPTRAQDIFGLTAAPSNLANFAVQAYAGQAKFTWQKPSSNSDLDVVIGGRIYVRWSPKVAGANWDYGSLVNPDGYPGDTSIGFGPLMTGTYMAKAADSSGNYSMTEASFVVTEALLTGLATLATVTESPAFTGSKSNVVAIDGGIQLDGTTLIDSMATLMDDWGAIDSLGGVRATGTYSFAAKMDLTSVKNARLFTNLDSIAFDSDDLIDSRTNNIDDWGLFDGAVVEDAEAQLMVRITNDDPNAAPTWGSWHALGLVADYNARGFDFRLDFATGNATHNRTVTTLAVTAKQ